MQQLLFCSISCTHTWYISGFPDGGNEEKNRQNNHKIYINEVNKTQNGLIFLIAFRK